MGKPAKPYPKFPCYAHASGRWAAKVAGKTRFFGRWGSKVGPSIVPVDDINASAEAAKAEYDRQVFFLLKGEEPPTAEVSGPTLRNLCNEFLVSKQLLVDAQKLSPRTFKGYKRATDFLIGFFGPDKLLESLGAQQLDADGRKKAGDFTRMARHLVKHHNNPVSLSNDIRNIKIVLKYAYDEEMIDKPYRYGTEFKMPTASEIRRAEQAHQREHGKRLIDAPDLLMIIESLAGRGARALPTNHANTALRAMVLLGVNCGLGQTDCANLEESHLDLSRGWLDYPRVKTAIERRIPLWPETVQAIREAIAVRPPAKRSDDRRCVFITGDGKRWVNITPAGNATDSVCMRFGRVLSALGLKRARLNFYALRHVTETIGGRCRDQKAVDRVMGHAPKSSDMGAKYLEDFDDDRLLAVTNTIRTWLFAMSVPKKASTKGVHVRRTSVNR